MKGLLVLLSLVGAALYALLVIAHNLIGDGKAGGSVAVQTQPNLPVVRRLSSWGSSLRELVISQQEVPTRRQQTGDYVSGAHGDENPNRNSERRFGALDHRAASDNQSTASAIGGVELESIEWAKVTLAARGHSEASVSSPIIRFYRPGTELRIVSREDGWLQLADPANQERAWVFEKYVSLIDGPNPSQAAVESTTENAVSKPRPAQLVFPSSRKLSRSAKPAVQASDDVTAVGLDARSRRWARRIDRRRGGFGLFTFGRSARFETSER